MEGVTDINALVQRIREETLGKRVATPPKLNEMVDIYESSEEDSAMKSSSSSEDSIMQQKRWTGTGQSWT